MNGIIFGKQWVAHMLISHLSPPRHQIVNEQGPIRTDAIEGKIKPDVCDCYILQVMVGIML